MKDVFTEKSGKLYDDLKELSFQMMLNETSKLQIENGISFSARMAKENPNFSPRSEESEKARLAMADKKGFELSLAFNELLLSNGYKLNAFANGPDSVEIWAENFLNKYGLAYPLSWDIDYQDQFGLHYKYDKADKIEANHQKFMEKVQALEISEEERKRIVNIANYYRERRRLLTKYINGEVLDDEEKKEHTR